MSRLRAAAHHEAAAHLMVMTFARHLLSFLAAISLLPTREKQRCICRV
jgi:hypothetical protein